MNEKDIVDIFLKLLDSTGFYWNFYVVGVAAIIGWILTANRHPSWHVKALVSTGFVFFVLMNLSALFGRYSFLNLFATELKQLTDPCVFKTTELCERIDAISFKHSKWVALGIHLVVDSALITIIWSDKVWGAIQRNITSKT